MKKKITLAMASFMSIIVPVLMTISCGCAGDGSSACDSEPWYQEYAVTLIAGGIGLAILIGIIIFIVVRNKKKK